MTKRILVVDDQPNIRLSYRYGLLSDEWQVEEASSGTDAVAKLLGSPFDLMLIDLRMPGLDGIQVLQKLQDHKIRLPAILVSAHATTDTVIQSISAAPSTSSPSPSPRSSSAPPSARCWSGSTSPASTSRAPTATAP